MSYKENIEPIIKEINSNYDLILNVKSAMSDIKAGNREYISPKDGDNNHLRYNDGEYVIIPLDFNDELKESLSAKKAIESAVLDNEKSGGEVFLISQNSLNRSNEAIGSFKNKINNFVELKEPVIVNFVKDLNEKLLENGYSLDTILDNKGISKNIKPSI